jgi:flagellar hook-length control protein FliK
MNMPAAVAGLFGSSATSSSALAVKPSSPPALEGGTDFQNMLDQARPAPSSSDDSSSAANPNDPSNSKPDAVTKQKKEHQAAHDVKATGRAQKPSAKQTEVDDAKEDGDAEPTALPQSPQTQDLPGQPPKAVESDKAPPKGKSSSKSPADGQVQQAAATDGGKVVQAVKPRDGKQSDSGKDSSRRASVRAVSRADGADEKAAPQAASTGQAESQAAGVSAQSQTESTAAKSPGGKEVLAIQPHNPQGQSASEPQSTAAAQAQLPASSDDASSAGDASVSSSLEKLDGSSARPVATAPVGAFADVLGAMQSTGNFQTPGTAAVTLNATPDAPTVPPEAQFAQANHAQIVSGIHGQLLPSGGNMQLRLDPPELGTLNIIVRIHEGVMNASFETNNDQATRMLSHSLSQLKTSLEAQGVSVGKLHVQQSPRNQQSDSQGDEQSSRDGSPGEQPAQREQQRREMLRRMWRRLSGGSDPLDLVA